LERRHLPDDEIQQQLAWLGDVAPDRIIITPAARLTHEAWIELLD
jgi:hypothetical protein